MNEIENLLSHSFEEIKGSGLVMELLKLSQHYLGLPYTNCEKEYFKYYEKLKALKNKPMNQKKDYLEKKYILKPGHLLYYNNTHFNNDTLTDQIAESAIKKFPALVNNFFPVKQDEVKEPEAEPEVIPEDESKVEPEAEPETKSIPSAKKKSVKK